ncbi:MAG TPA: major capsid protein [Pyrinomonadaceae bacterium]|jgi:hypothetical protein
MKLSWIEKVKKLTAAALTVRVQMLDPTDNGTLKWSTLFPRVDVQTHDVTDLITKDFRPVGARREWDAHGRRIPIITPDTRKINIIPIETEDLIHEQELVALRERFLNNQQLMVEQLKVTIPERGDTLAMAAWRTLEKDAMDAWLKGYIDQYDAQSKKFYRTSFGIDVARQTVAVSPWTSGAFGKFIAWLKVAKTYVKGGILGVMSSATVIQAIFDDAPALANGQRMGYEEFYKEIRNRTGLNIVFIENNETGDFFVDGGTRTEKKRYFDESYIAVVPVGGMVGKTPFAPVSRAQDLSTLVPDAKIDVRGVSVFHFAENDDKALKLQAQLDALPIPTDEKIYTTDTGIMS